MTSNRAVVSLVLLSLLLISSFVLFLAPEAGATAQSGSTASSSENPSGEVIAYRTSQGIAVDGLAEEPFWSSVPWTGLALTPSDKYAGAVNEVYVKAAHNSSWVFVLARWHDATESRRTDPVVRNASGGYVHNSTYYYGDILWVEWSLFNGGAAKPNVTAFAHTRFAGTPGSGKSGLEANLWSWRSYEDGGGPNYPYHYFPPPVYTWGPKAGQPFVFPYSSAYDSYLNASAQYFIGTGVMRVSACAAPLNDLDPFVDRAMGSWDSGWWTAEMARPYLSPQNTSNAKFDVQFAQGQSYWLAFLVADGNRGEVYSTNNLSDWVDLTLSPTFNPQEQQVLNSNALAQQAQYLSYFAASASLVAIVVVSYSFARRGRRAT